MLKWESRSFALLIAAVACLRWLPPAYAQPLPVQIGPNIILGGPGILQAGQAIQPGAAAQAALVIPGRHDASTTQPTTRPTPEVQALIDQLGEDSFAKRMAANDALTDMGQAIEPQLRGALEQKLSPEAANSLQTLVKKFDELDLYGPSIITIHAKEAPLRKVLEDFARQCDADVVVNGDTALTLVKSSTISIDLDHATFWDSMKQIEKFCSIPMSVGGNQVHFGQIAAVPTALAITDAPGTTVGPFFIQPQQCMITRIQTYGAQATGTVNLRLALNCEPKMTVVNNQITCSQIQNIDDRGHTLVATTSIINQQVVGTLGNSRVGWIIYDSFREVPDMGSHLKTIKADMKLSFQTGHKTVDIPDLIHAAGLTRDLAGGMLVVKDVTNANGAFRVELTFTSPLNVATATAAIANNPTGSAEFLDENGRQLTAQTTTTSRSINNNMSTWTWTAVIPAANGTPTTLRYETTTDSRDMNVALELHDIELPVGPATQP